MKTVKISNVIGNLIIFGGFLFLCYALLCAFTGVPVFAFIDSETVGQFAMSGTVLASAKGADKVVKVPFEITESTTTSGKACLLVLFEKENKKAMEAMEKVVMLLKSSSTFGLTHWPNYAQNPDKDKYIAIGTYPSNREILINYQTLNTLTAREIGDRNKAARKAEKAEARKAKGSKGNAGSASSAKIQAYKDLKDSGEITLQEYLAFIEKL